MPALIDDFYQPTYGGAAVSYMTGTVLLGFSALGGYLNYRMFNIMADQLQESVRNNDSSAALIAAAIFGTSMLEISSFTAVAGFYMANRLFYRGTSNLLKACKTRQAEQNQDNYRQLTP